jgi:hypothetical protein
MFTINTSNKMKREDFLNGIKYLTQKDLQPKPSLEKLERFGFSANDEASYYLLLNNPNLTDTEREQIKSKIKQLRDDYENKINSDLNYKNTNAKMAQ